MKALFFLSSQRSLLLRRITPPIFHLSKFPTPRSPSRHLHDSSSTPPPQSNILQPPAQLDRPSGPTEPADDDPMTEFLSRLVHALRPKLTAAFPSLPRASVDTMLLLICQRVAAEIDAPDLSTPSSSSLPLVDLSPELWETIKSESASIQEAMRKEQLRSEIRKYLHSDDVKQMCRFAGDVGIRGDLLRELRFKWAREKLEEVEFYRDLDRIRRQAKLEAQEQQSNDEGRPAMIDSLPQRKGKIKYKIYGLDLSDPEWEQVADSAEEAERIIMAEDLQPVEGRCKKLDDDILSMSVEVDPLPVLMEWKEALQPKKVDWLALLERIKSKSLDLYFKVAELLLSEESFEADIRDYTKLIDAYSKVDRVEDVERILAKLTSSKGFAPDILTNISLVHMYSRAGYIEQAKKAFEYLNQAGFQPDLKLYNSMIMAYVKAGDPKDGESLIREMEARDIKPTKEMYMALLRAFAERGQVDGAQRIVMTMQFAGIQPTLESSTLLLEAFAHAGDPDLARGHFDQMIKEGHKPDDRCTASMIQAYATKNLLDKALDLLLHLEEDGFQPGVRTNSVLVDWLGRLQLVEEAERIVKNISDMGDIPLDVHVSLCDMYARAQQEDKARKSLKILEARKELLGAYQFERIVNGLMAGGLVEDAKRVYELMQARGFTPKEAISITMLTAQSFPRHRSKNRGGKS